MKNAIHSIKQYIKTHYNPLFLALRTCHRAWQKVAHINFAHIALYILPFRNGLEKHSNRAHRIIVSFTSYPRRFDAIPVVLKSLVYQSMKPDKIILHLTREECGDDVPAQLLKLSKYGLEVEMVDANLYPHNKYFYAMQKYPDDIVITVDDDLTYPLYLIRALYRSYKKYPDCVSAMRVHRITKNEDGSLCSYRDWEMEATDRTEPSRVLFATGVGGVLYPPHCLPSIAFDAENIKRLCLYADDVWLFFMEHYAGVKVRHVVEKHGHKYDIGRQYIRKFYKQGLSAVNVLHDQNDTQIQSVMQFLSISPKSITD